MPTTTDINESLAGGYLLLDITLRRWTGKATDQSASSEFVTSKHAVTNSAKVVKDLMANANSELKAVASAQDQLRSFVYNSTLPWTASASGRNSGARLLAASKSFEFLAKFTSYNKICEDALNEFLDVYEARRTEAMRNLGQLAKATDYPTVDAIADSFGVSLSMVPCPAVEDFSRLTLPVELADALGTRLARQQQQQIENAMSDMNNRIMDELKRMATQLGKFSMGEKTRLFGSLITNMQNLTDLLRSSNLTNSDKVNDLVAQLDELTMYDIDQIKNSTAIAKTLAIKAATIANSMDEVFF